MSSQIPGDRIVPPDSLFGDSYDRSENEPEWNEYLDGKAIDLSDSHVVILLSFTDASLATLLIVAYPTPEGSFGNFLDGRQAMEKKQPLVKLSPVMETEGGSYFTGEVLGRHTCSMVISNVHFVINDPGGNLSKETVMEWSNRYAEFLRKSGDAKGSIPSKRAGR